MSFDPHVPPGNDPPPTAPPLEPAFSAPGMTEKSGLPRNIAAALACIFVLVGGIFFYVVDRRDRFVRFYSLQSIVLGGVFMVLGIVINLSGGILKFIPWLGGMFLMFFNVLESALGMVFLVLWIFLIVQSYRGKMWEMPFLWKAAKRHIPAALQ